jgi:hypothetical protein
MFKKGGWPIRVILINARASGGMTVQYTRAQRRTSQEGEVSYVLKDGKTIPPVLYKNITSDNTLFLYCDKSESFGTMSVEKPKGGRGLRISGMKGNFRPVEIVPAKITGIDTNVKNWAINSAKKGFKLWQDPGFFAKYGHFVATVAVLIAIGIMIYISLEKIIELDEISVGSMQYLAQLLEGKTGTPVSW